jgi:ATP-dependent helicase/nuclease subunit B
MTITLLQAPVGAGKTEAALNQIAQLLAPGQKPFARVWVLLATRRQEVAFRQRLVHLLKDQPSLFNIEFFNFYDLYRRLLNIAGQPQRGLKETGRRGLLRYVIRGLDDAEQLPQFHSIAGQPGLLSVLADFIGELKQNHVQPETFYNAAHTQKDLELATIYTQYQDVLRRYSLVDRDGEGWLAGVLLEEEIRKGSNSIASVDLLVVDGYDQFTPVQTNILALLSQQIETLITLTRLPMDRQGNPPPVGRRFEQTHQHLTQTLSAAGVPYRIEIQDEPKTRHPELRFLSMALGGQVTSTPDAPAQIAMVEAPDLATETAAVLRRVKSLLIQGVPPDEILIVLNDLSYQPYIEAYARLYRIPLLAHYVKSIATNPAVMLLIDVLELSTLNFPRRETLDVLRSPYLYLPDVTPALLAKLDVVTMQRQVINGARNWLFAIQQATEDIDQLDDGDDEKDFLKLTEEEANILSQSLQSFFELVSPPAEQSLRYYVQWLEDLIGSSEDLVENGDPEYSAGAMFANADEGLPPPDADRFSLHMVYQIHRLAREDDPWLTARDIQALNNFKDILRGLLQTQDLLSAIDPELAGNPNYSLMRWNQLFVELMQTVKDSQEPQRSPVRTGRVLVTTVADARGLPHQHIFIPGLAEGVFPAPVAEDPLYLDTERESLKERGVWLDARFERAADQSLFYEIVSQAHVSLTLSRPTAREGKPWPASHLWSLVQHAFPALKPYTIRTDAGIAPHEAASPEEALLAIAHAVQTNHLTPEVAALAAWLDRSAQADAWDAMRHNSAIETGRIQGATVPEYDGFITQPALVADIRERAKGWRWSANRLKNYGECGYKFFGQYLLSVQKLKDPEAKIEASTRGTLYHAILEQIYRQFRDERLSVTENHTAHALNLLDSCAAEIFDTAPETYGFTPPPQWKNEQKHYLSQLRTFIISDFSVDSPLNRFGERRTPMALEYTFTTSVTLYGAPTLITGTIDRVDYDGESESLIIVDYKSSRRPSKADMMNGTNVQMLIYAAALQALVEQEQWAGKIRAGVFWSIANNETEIFDFADDKIQVTLDTGAMHVQNHIKGVKQARFPIKPVGGKACDYCDFNGGLCRVAQRPQFTSKVSADS